MRSGLIRICLICLVALATAYSVAPQTRRGRTRPNKPPVASPTPTPAPAAEPSPEPTPPEPDEQPDVVKVRTDLVSFPIIATNVEGVYVPDLSKEEFKITEDGVNQQVAFFATTSAPFNVVLVLDTSASTREKLNIIRRSAIAFVELLQPGDRVKVISFDDRVLDLSEFTADRALLRSAINKTESGQGTKLYDAMELALSSLRTIQGRKAIVLFSDGVDHHSDRSTFEGTLHWMDEEEALVYVIQYNTRAETESIAREQANETASLPTIDVIRAPPSGTTAPTFPGEPDSVPTSGRRPNTGPMGLPSASEILRQRREQERERENRREDGRLPQPEEREVMIPKSDARYPRDRRIEEPTPTRGTRPRADDSISVMLDQLYLKADSYLRELTLKSGGRIVKAETLSSLPDAFSKIAAELRTQYAIGYYPTNKERDGKYRKVKVEATRKDVKVRARPGYRAPTGG